MPRTRRDADGGTGAAEAEPEEEEEDEEDAEEHDEEEEFSEARSRVNVPVPQPTLTANNENPGDEALKAMLATACRKRWETFTLMGRGKCDFSTAHGLKSFILHTKMQLCTRQASFMMHWRVTGDSDLQSLVHLAFVEATPESKRPTFERLDNFLDAWKILSKQYLVLRRSDAVRVQSELVTVQQKPKEPILQYLDRVEGLWQQLDGTALTVPEDYAIDHMRRGLSPDYSSIFAVFVSSSVSTFDAARRIVLRNIDARVSKHASGSSSSSPDVQLQLQQLQLENKLLKKKFK